jgi:peroxiredoxin
MAGTLASAGPPPDRGRIARPDLFLLVLLGLSLTLNVFLAFRLLTLPAAVAGQPRMLAAGTKVPSLEAKELDGTPAVIAYSPGDRPTLIYVFSPTCPWCLRNIPNIKAIAEARSADYRIVGLSLDGGRENISRYLAEHRLDIPVLVQPTAETFARYKLGSVPMTIVVSGSGEVEKVWHGAYGGAVAGDVSAFFSVSLPGLAPDDTAGAR